eukprot:jgi/Galph1/808/GphlegSOOS_G5465.1
MSHVPRVSNYPLVEVDDAIAIALSEAIATETTKIQSKQATGWIAAEDVLASDPFPPFLASIKDGYAVQHPIYPGKYPLVGTVTTGRVPGFEVHQGEVAYITTGAPLPSGADSVIPVEWTDEADDPSLISVNKGTTHAGQEVRQVGSDIPKGELILAKGSLIGISECALLINCGVESIRVCKKPTVAVFSTGNELIDIDSSPEFGEIYDANRPLLIAAVQKMNLHVIDLGIVKDEESSIKQKVEDALQVADVLVTSGGVSMGSHDYIKKILEEVGQIHFGRVRMKPGKPLTFATIRDFTGKKRLVIGLPGNPVSCYVCFYLLVYPLLRKLSGYSFPQCPIVEAELADAIRLDPERPEYHRCIVQWDFNRHTYVAKSTGNQSSSRLLSARETNALLILPSEDKTLPKGTLIWRQRDEGPLRDTFRFQVKEFVSTFRTCSPYISAHQNAIFVIHIPGQLLEETLFETTIQDIALLKVLGIKIVLVAGCRPQIDKRLEKERSLKRFFRGVRVTDAETMSVVKDAAGFVRYEIESKLSKGLFNTPTLNKFHVVSGNFFAAIPKGVIEGVDYGYTGEVRKIDADKVRSHLERGDIVILTNIGFSPSGELFNCNAEEVAASCAAQLNAEKLIFLTEGEVLVDSRTGSIVHNLPFQYAQEFYKTNLNQFPNKLRLEFESSLKACRGGVRRVHFLNRFVDGVLLMELYTRDGAGMMISRDIYEGIRKASVEDIGGILHIIEPLEKAGILIRRRRDQIEKEIDSFVVIERDGMVIACAALHIFPSDSTMAELACLAVHPEYRKSGKGDALLGYIERKAFAKGVRKLFILSTRTFQWFLERGFRPAGVEELPPDKQKTYNYERNSKIFMKVLEGNRAVDEEELLKKL